MKNVQALHNLKLVASKDIQLEKAIKFTPQRRSSSPNPPWLVLISLSGGKSENGLSEGKGGEFTGLSMDVQIQH